MAKKSKTKRSHRRKPRLDPRTEEMVTGGYKLGLHIGQQRERQRVEEKMILLRKTNRYLWDSLTALDRTDPINGIVISITLAKRINKKLAPYYPGGDVDARMLRKLIKEQEVDLQKLLKQFEKEALQGP